MVMVDISKLRCPICGRMEWSWRRENSLGQFSEWKPLETGFTKVLPSVEVRCGSCEHKFLAARLNEYWSDDELKQLRQENETLRKRLAKMREVMQAAVIDLQVHSQPEAGDNATTLEVRDLDDGLPPTEPEQPLHKLRPPVAAFAAAMEEKLSVHDEERGRHGWDDMTTSEILHRLLDEVDELSAANKSCWSKLPMMGECVDVANFAMMLYDHLSRKEGPAK